MLRITDATTIGEAFRAAVAAYGPRDFLAVPPGAHRPYHREGYAITYGEAGRQVEAIMAALRQPAGASATASPCCWTIARSISS